MDTILSDANHRIMAKDGGLFASLKLRMDDTNKNLVKQSLELCGVLAQDMGAPQLGDPACRSSGPDGLTGSGVSKYAKYVVLAILTCMADSKKHVAEAAGSAARVWVQECGLQPLLKYYPKVRRLSHALMSAWLLDSHGLP